LVLVKVADLQVEQLLERVVAVELDLNIVAAQAVVVLRLLPDMYITFTLVFTTFTTQTQLLHPEYRQVVVVGELL
jgi:hypothetical protein